VCCGATSAHAIDHHAALALAADTLAKAHGAGIKQLLAPCAMCYQRLAAGGHELAHKPELAKKVAGALGEKSAESVTGVETMSLLGWIETLSGDAVKALVKRPLKGMKVACYYGCLLVRPPEVTGVSEVEVPRGMERMLEKLGATAVRWSMATECCGGSFALSRKEAVLRLSRRIYDSAKKAGADVVCLACPMCHNNLDMRQAEYTGAAGDLPVVYLTQLMGLAFGVSEKELGLDKHFVPAEGIGATCPV
jgi:heterodisulfide reductase subunit B